MPFPWAEAMHAGLGRLRWPPEVFWRATPRELAAALHAPDRAGVRFRASDLAALLARFPDGAALG